MISPRILMIRMSFQITLLHQPFKYASQAKLSFIDKNMDILHFSAISKLLKEKQK